jgi:energy-coupling factor transporter ATP-binding protein EcfA2
MTRLIDIKFREFEGTPQEWRLQGLALGASNLVVGKNASGKSRTLNIISALARHLVGVDPPRLSANYEVEFTSDQKRISYLLNYEEGRVVQERVSIDDRVLLDRWSGGEGIIWAEEIDGGKEIRFQTAPAELAAVARRDAIQHPFLEALYSWGASVRHYSFGTALGKDHLGISARLGGERVDGRNPNSVVGLYIQAEKEFGGTFVSALVRDMGRLDYDIEQLGVGPPVSMRFPGVSELIGLYAKEKDLPGITDQHSMSQGMFRALSLLAQVNYLQMAGEPACILIDDIGEGLDFSRSCMLIDLLREKVDGANVQLVLATNDRFVMNRVPLEEWSVLQRHGNHVKVLNYDNSREIFEEFKFTGLSNFSFLEMDFASGPPLEETEEHEEAGDVR